MTRIAEIVAELGGIAKEEIFRKGRPKKRSDARGLFCYWCAGEIGLPQTGLARELEMTVSGIGYSVRRGEIIAVREGYTLIDSYLDNERPRISPGPEMADIIRRYGDEYTQNHRVPFKHLKVMEHIKYCRTAMMGGHKEQCSDCRFEQNAYNSCGDRHCPKCRMLAKERWLQARKAELLPTGYFHLVFTLPHDLNPIIHCNPRVLLGNLFISVNETLQAFAADPRWRLGGQLGFIGVLHTWTQTLMDHFHPKGSIQPDSK